MSGVERAFWDMYDHDERGCEVVYVNELTTRIAEIDAENDRLKKRESDLEYIAEKWCEHECVASDCGGCPLGEMGNS